ncbi:transketolase family protein [Candidatus Nomurabacteria bacterium]|uniref:Transketolase family protein n=1 Tax=candidate division WWE3 bacterium TaxID=2053526 RepID=A0A955E0R7_UNCKA|nr:transketolase family protein [candidate division WWE3 bacterium]MCB9823563.1 transketolase family protein [Candidatus Nomurabacteria bacterium]MCB9827358.1 transketolase family protein [Candidatus Nomurabacteria bacterium]
MHGLNPSLKSTKKAFGESLLALGKEDENVVVLCADLNSSTKTDDFAKNFPDRFFQVGIAEQNMAGIAAGLAACGKKVFITSFAAFSPMRNLDQIRVSICFSDLPVIMVGAYAGLSPSADGATAQELEDIAIMRTLPNTVVLSPVDYEQTKKATEASVTLSKPVYMRLCREDTPEITTASTPFDVKKAQTLIEGDDLTIVCTGPICHEAIIATKKLTENGIKPEVINVHTIKPFDKTLLLQSATKTRLVITVEEHQQSGGLGGAVAEILSEEMPTKVLRIGTRDTFGESGTYAQLKNKYGVDSEAIYSLAVNNINKK